MAAPRSQIDGFVAQLTAVTGDDVVRDREAKAGAFDRGFVLKKALNRWAVSPRATPGPSSITVIRTVPADAWDRVRIRAHRTFIRLS